MRAEAPSGTTTTAANAMTKEEIDAFLAGPHIGRLATIREDGFPHVTPIWFVWDGDRARFILGLKRLHMKNLKRLTKAGLCVDLDYRPPARDFSKGAEAVVLWGTVELVEDDERLLRTYGEQARKFIGPGADEDPAYIAGRDAEKRQLCVFTPAGMHTWDFRKAYATSPE